MASFAAILSETSMMWRKEVASYAEWIAKSLWAAKIRKLLEGVPATRLTQKRKAEAREALSTGNPEEKLTRPTICKGCGHITRSEFSPCNNCRKSLSDRAIARKQDQNANHK